MIQIKTTLKKQEVTPEFRKEMARRLARYFPDYKERGGVPYTINDAEGAYVIDNHNDWWCKVDDEDNQLVTITNRGTPSRPAPMAEYVFARWVAQHNDWSVVWSPFDEETGTHASITVDMTMWFPEERSEDDCGAITMDIPIEEIRVCELDGEVIPGARITGYTTGEYADVVDPKTGRKKRK